MTTETKQKDSRIVETFRGMVPLHLVAVGTNVRKHFNTEKMIELADNVRRYGVLEPILLRSAVPGKLGDYILIAGERRLRAAKEAGLSDIPARVLDVDAVQAAEIQAFENLHREDLTPIEEARAFKMLRGNFTIEQLAQKVDKSVGYVYRSIRLLELSDKVIDAIEDGRLTPAHGQQLLRLPPEQRQDAEEFALTEREWCKTLPSAAELKEKIDDSLGTDLQTARFPIGKPYAAEKACTSCEYNSGNQGQLFDGAEKGTCTNSPCFERKTAAFKANLIEKVKKDYPRAAWVKMARGYISANYTTVDGYMVKQEAGEAQPKWDFAVVISETDLKVWLAAKQKQEAKAAAPECAQHKPVDPKVAFIEEGIEQALMEAAAEKAKDLKMTTNDWRFLAEQAANDIQALAAAVLGVSEDDINLNKATEEQLRTIVLLNCRLPYQIKDVDFKKLGVDVAAVRKAATAQAEKDWIVHEASKGMQWPKNIAEVDKALFEALHSTAGAAGRWAKDKKTGLTDQDLRDRLAYELPISGGGCGPGKPSWRAMKDGFQIWLGGSKKEPSIRGSMTVNRARIILEIPYAYGAGGKA